MGRHEGHARETPACRSQRILALPAPTLRTLLRYVSSEAWAFRPTASNAGELRDMVSNPLEPTSPALGGLRSPSPEAMSSALGGLEEAASLLARGILRRRLRTVDGRKKDLDALAEAKDE